MNKNVLGIDLGTSSVKVLQLFSDGNIIKSRAEYKSVSPAGWWNAICEALSELELNDVTAISLSSQVGTYIVNDKEVISWNCRIGTEEVLEIKKKYEAEVFLREISMAHPNIVSYPIPRLKYIKENFEKIETICQPKDYICEQLTGVRVTDPYSWRGLANLQEGIYSQFFLNEIGIEEDRLPKMQRFDSFAGKTKEIPLKENKLPAGIAVYVGLNDYYASLLGMGIQKEGDLFDISGTSEHLGVIEKETDIHTQLVSGPYLSGNVHYGVTASSGASIKFGLKILKSATIDLESMAKKNPPIFLPYLNGERAPIWDADARGMYFGICEGCGSEELAYSALEGVVFSLYHIYETMGKPRISSMKISGGAAVFPVLNQLKAEMFELPTQILEENDTSALGAALIAAVGAGWYEDYQTAIRDNCKIKETIYPTGIYKEWLDKRYAIYKELYPSVKIQYERLKDLNS